MAKYRPYVQAVQWLGTNVQEIRQFVNLFSGFLTSAVIRNGVLFLEGTATGNPISLRVEMNTWLVVAGSDASFISLLQPTEFASQYELDVP